MREFVITKDSLHLLVSDLKRLTAMFEGSERMYHQSKHPTFQNSYLNMNKVYITEDFKILFKRVMETFDYIQKVEIEGKKDEQRGRE